MKKTIIFGSVIACVFILVSGGIVNASSNHANPIESTAADIVITKTCPTCHGKGVTYIKKQCYSCPGGVEQIPVTCSTCNGTGKITVRK